MWLTLAFPVGYPALPPIFELDSAGLLSYADEDSLYTQLLEMASCGEPMVLFELLVVCLGWLAVRCRAGPLDGLYRV